jgi:hypothetical protein
MTTLRAFQTEIDEIHNREVAKQRTKTAALAEKEEVKDQKIAATTTVSQAKGKAKEDGFVTNPAKTTDNAGDIRASLLEADDRILVWLMI